MHEYLREVDKLWKWCILPGPLEMWRRRDSWDSVKEWDTHPHTRSLTHTHIFTLTHRHTHSHTYPLDHSTHSHISTHTYSHSFSQLLSHTFSHQLSHTPTLLPGHAHTRPLMLSLTHTFSHVHTYLLTLTPNRTHSNLHTFSHQITHTLIPSHTHSHTQENSTFLSEVPYWSDPRVLDKQNLLFKDLLLIEPNTFALTFPIWSSLQCPLTLSFVL